jgi:DNA transformation protein and related proteins
MGASKEYTEYVLEFLESVCLVRSSRFFGGVGVSYDFVQFAMIMDNSLYFVVDEDSRKKYERLGMQPFSYMTKKRQIQVRKYFEIPEEILTDSEQLQVWVNESIQAAIKTKKPKKSLKG